LRLENSVTGTIGVIEMGTQGWKRIVVQDLWICARTAWNSDIELARGL
jgi:hypothetical protein